MRRVEGGGGVGLDESALIAALFAGLDDGDRARMVELLNTEREQSGARLRPRASSPHPAGGRHLAPPERDEL